MLNKLSSLADCKFYSLERLGAREGHITVLENLNQIPFEVKRVFYIYDIPGGESRGAHAHWQCHQFLLAASGSFQVNLEDGVSSQIFHLTRPYQGLYIPPGIWASESDFSGGAVCLVLTSHLFEEGDYIRDYDEFIRWRNDTSNK